MLIKTIDVFYIVLLLHVLVLIIIIYMSVAVRKKGWMRRFKEKLRSLLLSSKGESLSPLVTHMLNGLTMAFTSSRATYLSKMPNVFIIVLNKIFLGKKVNCWVYLFIYLFLLVANIQNVSINLQKPRTRRYCHVQ